MSLESYQYFLNIKSYIYNQTYLQGVPNLNEPFKLNFSPEPKSIVFTDENKRHKFKIMRKDLIDIHIEDQSSIESRLSISRLLLVGVFALAWKKRQALPLSFIIFEYKNDIGSKQQMIIQSDSKDSFQHFTNVKYNLLKFWKEIDENPLLLEGVEKKRIEHQNKEDADNKNFRIGCGIVLLIVVIFLLYIFYK